MLDTPMRKDLNYRNVQISVGQAMKENETLTQPNSQIDPVAIERLRRLGGRELISRMIELFVAHASPLLEQAQKDLQEGNFEGVKRAGHSLKSSAANVGATQMSSIAAEIENAAPAMDQAALEKLLARLQSSFDHAKQMLEQERSGH